MSLAPGTRLGVYEIVGSLGAGGMGEVYRARDTKLGRDVAIKALPEVFASDAERVARFEREAKLLAALNHPHIGGIYGFEHADGQRVLVLELVPGESLAERLTRSAPRGLEVDEALAIAGQVADALEAAHDKGIVHRDLKPANIMVTLDGDVKVLDFGLARAMETDASASAENSPTLTFVATQVGVILGTAAYMSPEQAKGRVADKRSDVWAFGCVLYEILAGKRAFEGEDVSDTLAAVLRAEPDWKALPDSVPGGVRSLIRRCLEKDRKKRVSDVSVARYVMNEPSGPTAPIPVTAPLGPAPWVRAPIVAVIGVLAGAALTAAGWWAVTRWKPEASVHPVRFATVPTGEKTLVPIATDRNIAFTPDGTHIVHVGVGGRSGGWVLVVRALDQLEGVALAGTAGARSPFVSPDGRWVGFFAGTELKKVSITGGPVIPICQVIGSARGATWLPDDTIVFATTDTATGLSKIPASGGEPEVMTKPDTARGEQDHVFPSALPDGKAILFTTTSASADNATIASLDLATGDRRILIRGGSQAQYVEPGALVYAIAGTLRAVRFDPNRREAGSDPVPVLDGVRTDATGAGDYAVSRRGHLVYVPGDPRGGNPRSLVWVDRQGHELPITGVAEKTYAAARLSPDMTRVALDVRDQDWDVWVYEFARQTLSRLTFDPAADWAPIWAPDSRRIIFISARAGPSNLFWHSADNTGEVVRLTTSSNIQVPLSMSRDGRLIMMEIMPKTGPDLFVTPLDGKSPPALLVQSPFVDTNADLSDDGRWLAYQSNEANTFEIYVHPFPNVKAGRWQISNGGGSRPVWAGRELFYLDGRGAMMSVAVEGTDSFKAGNPTKLFDTQYAQPGPWRAHDVAPDGKRFIMIKDAKVAAQPVSQPGMVVVLNWTEELKARLSPATAR
jgi:Protein kinase domain/WD40-like Beta Propeller Repeat